MAPIANQSDVTRQGPKPALPCAWCLAEQQVLPVTGSHGICQQHADAMRTQIQARHSHRQRKEQ